MTTASALLEPSNHLIGGIIEPALTRLHLSTTEAADYLEISAGSLRRKLDGDEPFTVDEIFDLGQLVRAQHADMTCPKCTHGSNV